MHLFYRLLICAFFAMVTMTAFSYIISATFRALYKEPVLLTYFLDELQLKVSERLKSILAWILHYCIGLGFVVCYHLLWTYQLPFIRWESGLLLGAISGIIGILGWVFIFRYTHHKPKIDFIGYYLQLLAAHIIFGLTAYACYVYL
ncbi:hypothetical protein [Flavobacterium tegetincola]|uniref:hypothetical protein n=1 Tax=Flavobacterium tegetincola TaxID=150172 RepID=UPI00041A0D5A|nr:hypothetical protein [Flavobacterium tegetincola]